MKAAIYTRTSGDGRRRNRELEKLRYYAWERDWQIVEYIEDDRSEKPRAAFHRLFTEAAAHRFHLILFWSLDRFITEGPRETLEYLDQLTRYGVGFCSASQYYLDTTGLLKGHVNAIIAALVNQKPARSQAGRRSLRGLQ